MRGDPPQSGGAASLVADAASLALNARSWKAEGSITDERDGQKLPEERFRIAYQQAPPFRARLEIMSGANPLTRTCDGSSQWIYWVKSRTYVRVLLPQIGPCADPLNGWSLLPSTLKSPTAVGVARVSINGRERECDEIRGPLVFSERNPMKMMLSICIDPQTKLILRYRVEESGAHHRVTTFRFSSLEHDVPLDGGLFEFHAPEGSTETGVIDWLGPVGPRYQSDRRVSNEVTAPVPISIVPAEGTVRRDSDVDVILNAEVDAAGVVKNVTVVRGLGAELDKKAVMAAQRWRFEPAISDAGPVTVATNITVRFRSR